MARVLVVDDHAAVRDLLREFLVIKGYEVDEAATGAEALSRLREGRPHLVLLDLTLPDMSGLVVLREVQAIDPAVGVIMITGVQEDEMARVALQAGAFDYITKPVDLGYLERSLWHKISTMKLR
jgi:DNA-binding response OmpR family regulator